MFRPLAINKNSICPYQSEGSDKNLLRSLMLLFFVVADAVDDAVVDCVVDDYFVVYYPPFHPMGKGVLLCCVVVDCWSLVVDCSKKWTLPTFYCQTLGNMRGSATNGKCSIGNLIEKFLYWHFRF